MPDPRFTKTLIVVGDRVLLEPIAERSRTNSGLYLPAGVKEKDQVQSGRVVHAGPGYPIPATGDWDEFLKEHKEAQYVPLQAREGDIAVYLLKFAHEIEYDGRKLVVVPHSAILLLERQELVGL